MSLATRLRHIVGRRAPANPGSERPNDATASPKIAPVNTPADLVLPPLSFAQEQLWFLEAYAPESTAYHLPRAWRIRGPLRADLLEQAFDRLVQRHESLRTTFQMQNGRGVQIISPDGKGAMPVVDLTGAADPEAAARRMLTHWLQRPFDLVTGPLICARLFRLRPQEHVLFINLHHIIGDGWSWGVLHRELGILYAALCAGSPPALPPLPWQYAKFARWQRDGLQGRELERQAAYWQQKLADMSVLDLPTDVPRPTQVTHRAASQPLVLSEALTQKLAAFNRQAKVTPFMSLLAVFQVLLYRYTGNRDIAVGAPMANRQREETEGLIGLLVNTVILRGNLAGNPSFEEFVHQLRSTVAEALQHPDLPLEELVRRFNPVREPGRNPLFRVVFALQNAPAHPLTLAGLDSVAEPLPDGAARFDLELHCWQQDGVWHGQFVYDTDLFTPRFICQLGAHFVVLLESLLSCPDRPVAQATLLTPAERDQLLIAWNGAASDYPREKSIPELFADQVRRTPHAVALVYEDVSLSYQELDARASMAAAHLQALGVQPRDLVAVRLNRSPELVVAILGVLKAGGAYWALEEGLPQERAARMLAEARPRVLLGHHRELANLTGFTQGVVPAPAMVAVEDWQAGSAAAGQFQPPRVARDDPAYVSYTSGSTGQPKGVIVPHRGVVRLVKGQDYANLSEGETLLHLSPLAFDASTFEIWGALLNGGKLAVLPPGLPTPEVIGAAIRRHGVTTLWLTAGLFHLMVEQGLEELRPLRQLLAGGDVLSPELVQRVIRALPGCRLINGYGPTENTTFTCCHTIGPRGATESSVPIGRPIANTRVYVLDAQQQLVPVGVPGELYAAGEGVALGYLNQPELSAEKFLPDPFAPHGSTRIYRTGDLVRWRPEGVIEFLGRQDGQVKIRGFRVEVGEVEAALNRHPQLARAAVMARKGADGTRHLAAWIVPRPGASLVLADLRADLQNELPDYLIPRDFVVVEQLPLNANGKLDRQALEQSIGRRLTGVAAAPRNAIEHQLCLLWQELLGMEKAGIQDDFFAAGGYSLLAMQLIQEIDHQFGVRLPLSTLFAAPTIAELAPIITQSMACQSPTANARFRGSGEGIPLFYVPGMWGYEFLPETIARRVGASYRYFDGFEYPGVHDVKQVPRSIEACAASLLPQLERVWPTGPCCLAGYSFGGTAAFELARQLRAKGREVSFVLLLDSVIQMYTYQPRSVGQTLRYFCQRIQEAGLRETSRLGWHSLRTRFQSPDNQGNSASAPEPPGELTIRDILRWVHGQYRPQPLDARVILVKVEDPPTPFCGWRHIAVPDPFYGWQDYCRGGLELRRVSGDHTTFMEEPRIQEVASITEQLMARANGAGLAESAFVPNVAA